MNKRELRTIYLERRQAFTPEDVAEKSLQVAERFFETFNLKKINYLHGFLPIEKFNEIETKYVFERLWQDLPFIQTVVPRVNFQTMEMEN